MARPALPDPFLAIIGYQADTTYQKDSGASSGDVRKLRVQRARWELNIYGQILDSRPVLLQQARETFHWVCCNINDEGGG